MGQVLSEMRMLSLIFLIDARTVILPIFSVGRLRMAVPSVGFI